MAALIESRDRELAKELRAPGPCPKGHPKMLIKSMPADLGNPRLGNVLRCSACAEIEAAVSEMRERCLKAAKRGFNSKSDKARKQGVYERIRALPLDAPAEAGGEK